jgi:4-amino-4-deoxy-L-arabinose transferase-like glycosyltransferase
MTKAIIAVILMISIFLFASTRRGTSWGDDWTMYVHHAKNMVEGKKYDEGLFLYNPHYPTYSPKSYSPGFPIILIPFYALFGLNIAVLKIPCILLFIGSLIFFVLRYRKEFSQTVLISCILLIGLSPYCWDLKDSILSDFALLFSVLLCAWAIHTYYITHSSKKYYILIGLLIYFAYAVKPLGCLFIPALFVFDLWNEKRITQKFLLVTLVFILFFGIQTMMIPGSGSYLGMVKEVYGEKSIGEIGTNILSILNAYHVSFPDFWLIHHEESTSNHIAEIYTNFFLILFGIGLIYRLIYKNSPTEWFILFYILVVLLFTGFQGVRYLVPLFPFFFVYVFSFLAIIPYKKIIPLICFVLISPLVFFYFKAYSQAPWQNIQWGIHEESAQTMFAYIRENTPKESVFVNSKPRALSLYTDRNASIFFYTENKNDLKNYMKTIHTNYVLVDGERYFRDWVLGDSLDFEFVFESGEFQLLKTKF